MSSFNIIFVSWWQTVKNKKRFWMDLGRLLPHCHQFWRFTLWEKESAPTGIYIEHSSEWFTAQCGMRWVPESPVLQVILPLAHLPLFILLFFILFWDWATLWPPRYRLTLIFQESSCLCLLSTGLAGVCPTLCLSVFFLLCFYPTSFFCLPLFLISLSFTPSTILLCIVWLAQMAFVPTVHRQKPLTPPPLANRLVFVYPWSSEN